MVKRLLLYIAVCGIGWTPAYAARDIDELFQKALVKESVQRDLEGAIHLYQQVVDESQGNRSASAEARLRMGICLEKLDKNEAAENVYRQILAAPSGVNFEILQHARSNLRGIELERKMAVPISTVSVKGVSEFVPSRFSVLLGPALLVGDHGEPFKGMAAGLRYQVSRSSIPISWFLDARGMAPVGPSVFSHQSQMYSSSSSDTATLGHRYQVSLGLLAELPHGRQRRVMPEMGAGLAYTASQISYSAPSSNGDVNQKTWRPYLEGGLHLWPDRLWSLHMNVRYMTGAYPNVVEIPGPPHSQAFEFPGSSWYCSLLLQLKLGRYVVVLVPKR